MGYHRGPCDNEGFVGGGRPTAGVEDWVGWGPRSGTQSLALRPQQMAAEQGGCRETLIVHAGWLSVREQRGRKGTQRRGTPSAGQEAEGDQKLQTVSMSASPPASVQLFVKIITHFSVTRWSASVHTLTCPSNGHWLHGDQATVTKAEIIT